jgi:hypothetical protein
MPSDAGERLELDLPLQLLAHVRQGDLLHLARHPDVAYRVLEVRLEAGLVSLERDWAGPTFSEWLYERAGVIRGE